MLIMFRAKNFTSFHNEVILDLRASSYKQHPSHIIPFNKEFGLLKTVAIYGANASGKSNLISAMYCFEEYIFRHLFKDKNDESVENELNEKSDGFSMEPFLLAEPVEKCIEFEIIFEHNKIIYQYGFSFEDSKIITEWLYIDNELVFDRNCLEIKYGKKYKEQLKDYKKYREDRLYLSVLDYFSTDKIKEHIDNFKNFFQKKFKLYFELFFESSIKGILSMVGTSKYLVENEDFRKRVAEYIRMIDVGIIDLIVDKKTKTQKGTGAKEEVPVIKTVHAVYDSNENRVKDIKFNLEQESTGTLRFLSFIPNILLLLENGGVFIIDELSARLHPLLAKFIIDIFQSELNDKNAQLIFTTHDVSLLNKEQFRRDEIFFVDKNEKGESIIYSLADFKNARQDSTYNKDYFNGKYGAIPIIQSLQIINGGE